jgi:Zn-finger nucleic acid-binding protein
MQSVQRSGVEFDMCPTCRGVWLDRGELEKLVGMAREPDPGESRQQQYGAPPREQHRTDDARRDDYRRDEHRRHDYDDDDYKRRYGYKKRRGFDIFDIFD